MSEEDCYKEDEENETSTKQEYIYIPISDEDLKREVTRQQIEMDGKLKQFGFFQAFMNGDIKKCLEILDSKEFNQQN